MTFLALVFFAMFVYGLFTAHLGAGLIALGMVFFTLYAKRHLARREEQWRQDPARAQVEPDSISLLDKQECESGSHKI